jgi:hypothetical protein
LGIDAVGFQTYEFATNKQLHEQLYQELQKTGKSYQLITFRDADGKFMKIQLSAQIVAKYPKWGIFRVMVNS